MAEREGFEPTVLFRYSRFPGVRLKPLSHLSTEGPLLCVTSGWFAIFFGLQYKRNSRGESPRLFVNSKWKLLRQPSRRRASESGRSHARPEGSAVGRSNHSSWA